MWEARCGVYEKWSLVGEPWLTILLLIYCIFAFVIGDMGLVLRFSCIDKLGIESQFSNVA